MADKGESGQIKDENEVDETTQVVKQADVEQNQDDKCQEEDKEEQKIVEHPPLSTKLIENYPPHLDYSVDKIPSECLHPLNKKLEGPSLVNYMDERLY